MRKYVILYDKNMFLGVGKKKEGNIFQSQAQNVFFFPHGFANIALAPSKAILHTMRTCFLKGTKTKIVPRARPNFFSFHMASPT